MADEDKVSVTEIKKTADGIGTPADLAKINPADSATIIALLKGILKQLQGTGTGAAPMQLTGSIVENWLPFSNPVSVTAGSTVTSAKFNFMSYPYYALSIRPSFGSSNRIAVIAIWNPEGVSSSTAQWPREILLDTTEDATDFNIPRRAALAPGGYLQLRNKGGADMNYYCAGMRWRM